MEEFQNYFETDDQDVNKEIAGLLSFIHGRRPLRRGDPAVVVAEAVRDRRRGRGAAVQPLPRQPRRAVRAQVRQPHRLRGHPGWRRLRRGLRRLGPAERASSTAASASSTAPATTPPRCAPTWPTTATRRRSCTAARRHRVAAGTLTGYAAGEVIAREIRDALADVRGVFTAGENGPALADHRRPAGRGAPGALRRHHRRGDLSAAAQACTQRRHQGRR